MKNFQYIYLAIYLFALLSLLIYGMNCYFLMIYYRINYRKAINTHKAMKERFYQDLPTRGCRTAARLCDCALAWSMPSWL